MKLRIHLVFFKPDIPSPLEQDLIKFHQKNDQFTLNIFSEIEELRRFISTNPNIILLFLIRDKNEFQSAIKILAQYKKFIKEGVVRPACLLGIQNKKAENILERYGCTDLLPLDTQFKTLSFKLESWINIIFNSYEQSKRISSTSTSSPPEKEKHTLRALIGGNKKSDKSDDKISIVKGRSSGSENELVRKAEKSREEYESEMLEALSSAPISNTLELAIVSDNSEVLPSLDLESGSFKVLVKQKTDRGNEITFICDFEDFYEDELTVHSPRNSLAPGSLVKASVRLQYNGEAVKIDCLGKIQELEDFNEEKDILVISISHIDKDKYAKFIELYQNRQGSINNFMKAARGY